ncbi:hypothetical protein CAPTEDRAFT_220807 [Capitella teleta]|uniref:Uncharacterized protein n=1 Tax=Capitella teleta TaxID=283909 RepID=R7U900_CAPTE|nr:hypothetical protein CAPTEDRAFT_220807 [Capitella teleta]|eukprot:ELU00177.1 hypothetical protein CAPTEDRAFT_220807 [Capitella teleta]
MSRCVLFLLVAVLLPLTEGWWFIRTNSRQKAEGDIKRDCIAKAKKGTCDFFVCFDQRHPCEHSNYALSFGWKFCTAFDQHYARFDAEAKNWINGTRKCVMEAMLEFYNEEHVNCQDVSEEMKDAHGRCGAENGICSLPLLHNNKHVLTDIYGVNEKTLHRMALFFKHCGKNTFYAIGDWFTDTFKGIWPKVDNFFSGFGDKLKEGFEATKDTLKEWGNTLKDVFT